MLWCLCTNVPVFVLFIKKPSPANRLLGETRCLAIGLPLLPGVKRVLAGHSALHLIATPRCESDHTFD